MGVMYNVLFLRPRLPAPPLPRPRRPAPPPLGIFAATGAPARPFGVSGSKRNSLVHPSVLRRLAGRAGGGRSPCSFLTLPGAPLAARLRERGSFISTSLPLPLPSWGGDVEAIEDKEDMDDSDIDRARDDGRISCCSSSHCNGWDEEAWRGDRLSLKFVREDIEVDMEAFLLRRLGRGGSVEFCVPKAGAPIRRGKGSKAVDADCDVSWSVVPINKIVADAEACAVVVGEPLLEMLLRGSGGGREYIGGGEGGLEVHPSVASLREFRISCSSSAELIVGLEGSGMASWSSSGP